jgi:MSHA biogenesis protein MshJ
VSSAFRIAAWSGSGSGSFANRVRQALAWIDERTLRERALLLAVCVGVLYTGWVLLLMQPVRERQAALREEEHQVREQIEVLGRQEAEIRRAHAADPDRELHARAETLIQQIGVLDERVRQHTAALVPPREMAKVLEEVLRREDALQLVRLEHLGAEPILEPSAAGATSATGIFRHRFELELQGGYLATLGYLRALEQLPWEFFWEALEYRVDEYPEGTATIRAFTLGAEEGWVGA